MLDFNTIIPIVSGIVAIAVVVILGIDKWKSGSNQITSQVVSNYETLVKQQKDNIEECRGNLVGATKDMHEMEVRTSEKIAKLDGTITEKDRQLQEYAKIIANRSPELENVLKNIRDFMEKLSKSDIIQAKILVGQKEREEGIDEATRNHTGNPSRAPE